MNILWGYRTFKIYSDDLKDASNAKVDRTASGVKAAAFWEVLSVRNNSYSSDDNSKDDLEIIGGVKRDFQNFVALFISTKEY